MKINDYMAEGENYICLTNESHREQIILNEKEQNELFTYMKAKFRRTKAVKHKKERVLNALFNDEITFDQAATELKVSRKKLELMVDNFKYYPSVEKLIEISKIERETVRNLDKLLFNRFMVVPAGDGKLTVCKVHNPKLYQKYKDKPDLMVK
jgi:hypothetical protein